MSECSLSFHQQKEKIKYKKTDIFEEWKMSHVYIYDVTHMYNLILKVSLSIDKYGLQVACKSNSWFF